MTPLPDRTTGKLRELMPTPTEPIHQSAASAAESEAS